MNQAPISGRKKVLFLITKATWGGAQKYVFDLATHIPAERFDVSVAYGESGKLSEMLKEKNIPTHQLPTLGRDVAFISDISSFFQIARLLKKERPDVLHVNSSKAAALGALAARLCGVKRIVFTAHGWPFKENRNTFARVAIHFVSWFTAVCSHAVIVVSKNDEAIGKRMWPVGKKIHYVPLGIETPAFLSRGEAAIALSISTVAPRIVTIAELTENKGLIYAIHSVAELKKRGITVDWYIIGEGELREGLERHARADEVADHIHFLGFVDNAAQYLKAFDIFVLSSIKEGMPYVLFEAIAAELPIITTRVVDVIFLASFLGVTVIDPGSVSAIVNAIEKNLKEQSSGVPSSKQFPFPLLRTVQDTTAVY